MIDHRDTKARVGDLDPKITDNIQNLRLIAGEIIERAAFLSASVGNKNQEKLRDSFSGHALHPLIRGSAHLCIVALCRFWDKSYALETIQAIKNHQKSIQDIRKRAHPDWPDPRLQIGTLEHEIDETIRLAAELLASPEYRHCRSLRTERLAHFPDGPSRDRKKLLGEHVEPSTKYDDLNKLSIKTLAILDRMISHWEFHVENSQDTYELFRKYSLIFWDSLPYFSKVENDAILWQ